MEVQAIVSRPPWVLILAVPGLALAGASAIALWPDRPVARPASIETEALRIALRVPIDRAGNLVLVQRFAAGPYRCAMLFRRLVPARAQESVAHRGAELEAREAPREASFEQIAKQLKVPLAQLRRLNPSLVDFGGTERLPEGTVLVIPSPR